MLNKAEEKAAATAAKVTDKALEKAEQVAAKEKAKLEIQDAVELHGPQSWPSRKQWRWRPVPPCG